jgi:hypothetical protein
LIFRVSDTNKAVLRFSRLAYKEGEYGHEDLALTEEEEGGQYEQGDDTFDGNLERIIHTCQETISNPIGILFVIPDFKLEWHPDQIAIAFCEGVMPTKNSAPRIR